MSSPQVNNLPCWQCGSSDACAYYKKDDSFYCHICKEFLNNNNEEFEAHFLNCFGSGEYKEKMQVASYQQSYNKQDYEFPQRGVVTALEGRGIGKQAAEKYKVETLFDATSNKALSRAFPGYDKDGNLVGQKIKTLGIDSKPRWVGNHGHCTLFGMSLFPKGGKYVTITEGEEDALAAYEMLKANAPAFEPVVVSVNDGAQTAESNCKKPINYDFLNSFENIIIAFDGDGPGKKAAERVAQLFPFKAKVLNFHEAKEGEAGWNLKDSNDYLKAGKQKEFINMWYRAEKFVPKGVRTFNSLWDDMISTEDNLAVPFPFEGLNKKLFGMTTGRFGVVKAFPKIGKTLLFKLFAHHIIKTTAHNVGLILLEETNKTIGLGMCAIEMQKPLLVPTTEYSQEELQKVHRQLSEGDRLTTFDPTDDRTAENIFNKIMYFVKAHDCKFIFLDHASMLSYQSGEFDERKFLDKLFADLKALTTSLNIHLQVIIHVNDDGKTRGSRAPVQLCDWLISLERDKLNEDPIIANTTNVIVEENRISGDSGLACSLWYDKETGLLYEQDAQLLSEMDRTKDNAKLIEELKQL